MLEPLFNKVAKVNKVPFFKKETLAQVIPDLQLYWKIDPCTGVLSPAILLKKRLWHRCFPMNYAKFLRRHFYRAPLNDCSCTLKD